MITQALHNKLQNLATKQRFNTQDAEELQAVIRENINPRYSVCLRCAQQLKHGQKVILSWLSTQEIIENIPMVVEETIFEMPELPELVVDEVEADKVGCTKCKSKKKTKM
jgi:alpha-amylase/alpha-mannosidase (GH57 family)